MATLKDRLRADLTAAIKARDATTTATLRMALTAIGTEEVAGKAARELSDDEVVTVLTREAKKRREAAEAFAAAGRAELAARERAEGEILATYLPTALSDEEVDQLVAQAISEVEADLGGPPGSRQMGLVMKLVTARAGGRAEGARLAAVVRIALRGATGQSG